MRRTVAAPSAALVRFQPLSSHIRLLSRLLLSSLHSRLPWLCRARPRAPLSPLMHVHPYCTKSMLADESILPSLRASLATVADAPYDVRHLATVGRRSLTAGGPSEPAQTQPRPADVVRASYLGIPSLLRSYHDFPMRSSLMRKASSAPSRYAPAILSNRLTFPGLMLATLHAVDLGRTDGDGVRAV